MHNGSTRRRGKKRPRTDIRRMTDEKKKITHPTSSGSINYDKYKKSHTQTYHSKHAGSQKQKQWILKETRENLLVMYKGSPMW